MLAVLTIVSIATSVFAEVVELNMTGDEDINNDTTDERNLFNVRRRLSDCPAEIQTIIDANNKKCGDKPKISCKDYTDTTWSAACTTYSSTINELITAAGSNYDLDCSTENCDDWKKNFDKLWSDCKCGGSSCFSLSSTTITDTGVRELQDLKVGDMVQTQVGYEPVLGFIHKSEKTESSFFRIKHDTDTLEVSPSHMLFLVNGQSIFAKQVLAGDVLSTPSGSTVVRSVLEVEAKGFIAPLTPSGTILVNGVLASTYAADGVYFPQWVFHIATAPWRVAMSLFSEVSSAIKPIPVVLTS